MQPIILAVETFLACAWNFAAKALMQSHICMQLPLAGRQIAQQLPLPTLPGPLLLQQDIQAQTSKPCMVAFWM